MCEHVATGGGPGGGDAFCFYMGARNRSLPSLPLRSGPYRAGFRPRHILFLQVVPA
jgi:hypothetical protein